MILSKWKAGMYFKVIRDTRDAYRVIGKIVKVIDEEGDKRLMVSPINNPNKVFNIYEKDLYKIKIITKDQAIVEEL